MKAILRFAAGAR